ncbi:hypothetical protein DLAC_10134 [Tieghemostelium lacteum]|uniref:Peptidase M28 domain-containing protein n=1 Tax=Tieghemostelium lacteum TaxID=361077 RepID=A0A151Z675_TIELA|nr:hypothetical protein DLAC_10134 [Tieghemostelium lacteum]|eukprot:KYQ89463.1 hypothetical protein DLAC_10134 [Tieghemostelium lacteum]
MSKINIRLVILIIVSIGLFGISRFYQYNRYSINTPHAVNDIEILNINANQIIRHTEKLIDIGNSKFIYEESRSLAREYIKDYLIANGVPNEQIIYNRFEWTERKSVGRNITTTTWTGINIMVWINTTSQTSDRIRVIGAHYDTVHWGENRTSGAHDNLSGTGLLIETCISMYRYQRHLDQQVPYLFVFFDQEEPGALGSKSFVDHYKVAKNKHKYAYFIDVDSMGYKDSQPLIVTYPYEHNHQTLFSPRWLVDAMVQASYHIRYDGITVGTSRLTTSLAFQAQKHHLLSIRFLSDDGPFTWSGVDSLLLTDLDLFYGRNVDYHKITDQPKNLDSDLVKDFSLILTQFLVSTSTDQSVYSLNTSLIDSQGTIKNPLKRLFYQFMKSTIETIFSGNKQYLIVGPICFGYFDLILFSTFILLLIYLTSYQHYKDLIKKWETIDYYSQLNQKRKKSFKRVHNSNNSHHLNNNNGVGGVRDEEQQTYKKLTGAGVNDDSTTSEIDEIDSTNRYYYRKKHSNNSSLMSNSNNRQTSSITFQLMLIHLWVMFLVSLVDPTYCFEILALSFLSLMTIHHYQYSFNLFTGFLSGAFCANFIYMDILMMRALGRKGSISQELTLGILLGIYIVHSILIVVYGYNFGRKMEQYKKFEKSLNSNNQISNNDIKEDLEK